MREAYRDFVLDAAAPLVLSRADAGGDGLAWANGGPVRTARRTWLDTFDWRLYRAGLTLEQVAAGGRVSLVLAGRDGQVLATEGLAAGTSIAWPALLDGLPPGPVREALEPVAGIRALQPVARALSHVRDMRALNADDKTVARLAVDQMSVTFPERGDRSLVRARLAPVRGYLAQTDRVSRVLAGLPGVSAAHGSALEAALAATGRVPGERSGKAAAAAISGSMPASAALAAILTALLDALEANVPGAIRDIDTEYLHDLRIAVRWTRSALKLCGSALPHGLARAYRPEFRWLGDLTTPTRDLDVYLLGFPAMAAGLVGAAECELGPFRDYLVATRGTAQRRLAKELRSARFTRLLSQWRVALDTLPPAGRRPTAARLAAERITTAQRRAVLAGRLITPASPPELLHDLRKRCKELRYLVEMFGSLHDPAQHWQAVRELKTLQDCLGEFQDTEVQRTEIRAFAAQMVAERSAPAETLLAMGEIAAGLALRQRQARAEFDGRFAAFSGMASQARLTALAGRRAAA
ncbi:MAG TPA: CHAD domain-containing protein [Streptosporangiaceae bacterium]|jgi:CHAD domain-containing protein